MNPHDTTITCNSKNQRAKLGPVCTVKPGREATTVCIIRDAGYHPMHVKKLESVDNVSQ